VWVEGVSLGERDVTVDVGLRRRRLACPYCEHVSWVRHDSRPVDSTWVHLNLGRWGCVVRARLRRLRCPTHGVVVEAVPFARPRARFTRDFEDLVAWLVTKMDKTAVTRLARIDWKTVGRICQRVCADGLDESRLDGLVHIGVDEVACKRGHSYLTLVADHTRGKIVWGAEGRDTAALDGFFGELGAERSAGIEAVSMDMAPAYAKSVTRPGHAAAAQICTDPFHVVKAATDALNTVRRAVWQQMRTIDPVKAKTFKGGPLGAAEKPAGPLRRAGRHTAAAAAPRRPAVARLPAQGVTTRRVRRRPGHRRGDPAARPVDLPSATLSPGTVRQDRQDRTKAPRPDPGRHPAGHQQRPLRRPGQRRTQSLQPRLRSTLRPGRPRPSAALLWT
jgi:transposase